MENIVEEQAIAYPRRYTPDEYLKMDWINGVKYEYWEGELLAMSLATMAHNRIISNINRTFQDKKEKDNCGSFHESIMVRPGKEHIYFLPDVVLTCHPDDKDPQAYEVKNPTIIVEVLSDSTELYDRTQKWDQYRKIKSLRHYLLVSQHQYRIEMYSRANERSLFYYQVFEGLEDNIPFNDRGFEMRLEEVYKGIALEVEKENQQ